MASCSAGDCDVTCTDGCGCISLSDDPLKCNCYCFGEGKLNPFDEPVVLSSRVHFEANEIRLVDLALFLNANFGGEIMIPASSANTCVSVTLEDVEFADVLEKIGLEWRGGKD